jgi:5-methylthioadenosine/S-adenosylhomocysteine deaminase
MRPGISRRQLLGAAAALSVAGLAPRRGEARAASRRRSAPAAAQLPARGEFVVRDAYVLTMDPALGDLPRGDIHVRDGAIVAVGAGVVAPGAEVIDGQGMIALPGLVETHWHLWNTLARSMAGDRPENGYFPLVLRLGRQFTPEDAYRAVRLALADALYSGITTVHNWAHNLRGPAYADAELRAHVEVGLRARFSYGAPQGHPPDEPIDLADLERVQQEWFAAGRAPLLTLGLAARGPATNPPAVYRREWETARRLGVPISVHVATSRQRAEQREIETLGREGLLGPDVQLIHAIYATPADRELMARTGTSLSISPWTELLIGFGFPQINEMLADGVRVSLSVDTTALSGTADMFSIMRVTVNLAHGQAETEFGIGTRRVLELATIDGARDLGLADRIGSLTPGKRADLILVRTTDVNIAPFTDPVHMLVLAAQPANVDTVVVDGRILKRGGELVALDVEQVVREAAESLAAVRARAGEP